MDYSILTDRLNNLISSETGKTDWKNIPGGLEKVSESSMGAVWGINQGSLYVCLSPCNGNWVLQDSSVLDFTLDDSLIYILKSGSLNTKNANNSGEVLSIPMTLNLTKIFNTSSYIWGQDSAGKKYKLAKPGTTSNWVQSQDTSGVLITSASSSALYGIDSKGAAFKTDESLQSSWSPIPQFKGMLTGILGDANPTLYATDGQELQQCEGELCETLPVPNPIRNLSPNSKNLWMTSPSQGDLGNIYVKDLTSSLIDDTQPIDELRDSIVQDSQTNYNISTYSTILSNQASQIQKMFTELLSIKKIDTTPLESSVNGTQGRLSLLTKALPILLQSLVIIILLIIVYLCSGILGFTTHYVALIVFVGGIYFILNLNNGM